MRPVRLKLQAFGSFPGSEDIDFEALGPRGLFVVSGDTGTGKTTIFDAMCWALYGRMPRKESGEVRSHHVAPQIRTEVEFTFECEGERYVVTRNPEQLKPARRGAGHAKEPAGAHLVRVLPDGGTEPLATKATDVLRECTRIVGLGPEQFERVVLLPQGEFARFLLADTAAREPLLGQLFGGHVFDGIVAELKAEWHRLREQVADADQAITEQLNAARTNIERACDPLGVAVPADLAEADRPRLGAVLDTLDGPLLSLQQQVQEMAHAAATATSALAAARAEAARFDSAAELGARLADLDRTRPEVEAGVAAAERSARSRPVVVAAEAATAADAAATASGAEGRRRREEIAQRFSSIGVEVDAASVAAVMAAIAERHGAVERDRATLVELAAARARVTAQQQGLRDIEAAVEEELDARQAAADRGNDLAELIPAAQAAAIDPAGIDAELRRCAEQLAARRRLDEALRRLATDRSRADEATARHAAALDAFIGTEAPRLAATLREGEPCPVCGSCDHPRPAGAAGQASTTYDDVLAAARTRDSAAAAVGNREREIAEAVGALGSAADTTLETLALRQRELTQQRTAADTARQRLDALTTERDRVREQIARADRALAVLEQRRSRAVGDLQADQAALARIEPVAATLDPADINRRAAVLGEVAELSHGLEECYTRAAAAASHAEVAQQALRDALAASPFDDVAAAREVLLTEAQERAAREARERHDRDRATTAGALQVLVEQGVPEQRPDLAAVEQAAAAATAAHGARAAALRTATDAMGYAAEALARHDRLHAGSAARRHRAEVAELAHTVCSRGGGGVAMSLKRWVLTRELDRVTAAANIHLAQMTGERYTLRRKEERDDQRRTFGLDIEVLDAQTGRARSTASLSGGEQFQASLSLALGLADVVSRGGTGSGRRFEALFVDEGFGSLSAESLDDAVETLHHLHASGRMVGAITHVEAMKQQLHVGIEVLRRADGVGSTVRVHP